MIYNEVYEDNGMIPLSPLITPTTSSFFSYIIVVSLRVFLLTEWHTYSANTNKLGCMFGEWRSRLTLIALDLLVLLLFHLKHPRILNRIVIIILLQVHRIVHEWWNNVEKFGRPQQQRQFFRIGSLYIGWLLDHFSLSEVVGVRWRNIRKRRIWWWRDPCGFLWMRQCFWMWVRPANPKAI
jgi:hypothetical protein